MLNRFDLICKVAKDNNISIAAAKRNVDMTFNALREMIITGEPVLITRLGRFEPKVYTKETLSRNPKTLKVFKTVRAPRVAFKASDSLRDQLLLATDETPNQ